MKTDQALRQFVSIAIGLIACAVLGLFAFAVIVLILL